MDRISLSRNSSVHKISLSCIGAIIARPLSFVNRKFLIRDKFCNILQPAIQKSAQFIQRFGFHIVVGSQVTNRLAVDAALLTQLVCGNLLLLHRFPKAIKSNHRITPLTHLIMGVIILNIKGDIIPIQEDFSSMIPYLEYVLGKRKTDNQ